MCDGWPLCLGAQCPQKLGANKAFEQLSTYQIVSITADGLGIFQWLARRLALYSFLTPSSRRRFAKIELRMYRDIFHMLLEETLWTFSFSTNPPLIWRVASRQSVPLLDF